MVSISHLLVLDLLVVDECVLVLLFGGLLGGVLARPLLPAESERAPTDQAEEQQHDGHEATHHGPKVENEGN